MGVIDYISSFVQKGIEAFDEEYRLAAAVVIILWVWPLPRLSLTIFLTQQQ